jgi:predicted nucleotidyltransferase
MAKVGVDTILDTRVEIWATNGGTWQICMPGEEDKQGMVLGHGDTLDRAVTNARVQINKNKVKLHIDFVNTDGKRGYATGVHGRTRKILTVIQGEKVHLDNYATVFRADMPNEEIEHMHKIDEGIAKLQAARREIVAEWKFDLGKAVTEAIEEGVQGSR